MTALMKALQYTGVSLKGSVSPILLTGRDDLIHSCNYRIMISQVNDEVGPTLVVVVSSSISISITILRRQGKLIAQLHLRR